VRVAPDALVRAFFTPRALCPAAKFVPRNIVGVAVSTPGPGTAWESWIEFTTFGAARPGDATDTRMTGDDFRVAFGERLTATFDLKIDDGRVVEAIKERNPIPDWEIRGRLSGRFDFVMKRGHGAQTFP
jgi:hypothetical protein